MGSNNLIKRYTYEIVANDFNVAGKGSSNIKKNLKALGIDAKIIRNVSIVSYEAEINIVIHSLGGKLHCDLYEDKIVIVSEDIGPGIIDVERAMLEGFSTATDTVRELGFGAGMGLPNMIKCSSDFEIHSDEKGTIIKITVNI